jgi:branched-chain amino acid transport system substrate-binding protein
MPVRLNILLILLISLISFSGRGSDSYGEEKTLKIGAVYPLTGSMAKMGNEELRGTELAIKEINDAGGINGCRIVLAKADAPDPNTAVSEAERLINLEKVPLIVGSYSSGVAFAASAVAERNRVVYWEMGGVVDDLVKRGFKYTFRTVNNQSGIANPPEPTGIPLSLQSEAIKEVIAKRLGKDIKDITVALIHENSSYGTGSAAVVNSTLKSWGAKVVLKESYDAKTNDLSSLVLKIKKLDPDVLCGTTYINDAILFLKQCQEMNYTPKSIVFNGNATKEFVDGIGPKIAEGLLTTENPQRIMNDAGTPGQKEFYENYKKVYGTDPSSPHSLRSYVGTKALAEVLKNCIKNGTINPDDFAKAAYSLDIPIGKTASGWGIKFLPPGNPMAGQNYRSFGVLYVFKDGKSYAVYPSQFAVPGILDSIKFPLPSFKSR